MSELTLSIHPRNWPSTGNGKLKNTCRASNGAKRTKKRVEDRHIRRLNDWAAIPTTIQPGYRKPGSRNPAKLRQR